ncbi:MAG: DUF4870 domain-containing protein [Bacteroidales bacterium]|nr:MAG: DUF4870 domain-containing protein [Bacteroidales bacterium]
MREINYINSEEQTFSMLCHLSALSGCIIPFGHIIGPLIFWSMKKQFYPEVDRQGKDAINFQISMTLWMMVSGIMVLLVIGIFALIALGVLNLVMIIVASVKSNNGERFKYPLTIDFIR